MDHGGVTTRVEALVTPIVAAMGLEIVDVQWLREAGRWMLRLFVDYPSGGINLDDCGRVSRAVEGILAVEGDLPGPYVLEVSSPGVDRPLRRLQDFQRVIGRVVEIRTSAAVDGRSHFKGPLTSATESTVVVNVDRVAWGIPFERISRARLRYFEKQ